jgi:Holliday junction resolvase
MDKTVRTKKQKGNDLENLVIEYLRQIDSSVKRSRASGASNDIGDIVCKDFFVEAKNWNKENVIIDQKIWQHLLNQMPINSTKTALLIQKSNNGRIFVSLEIKDFFNLLYKLQELETIVDKVY